MDEHSIGKTIASLRKSKGWTQVELAEKLNVSDKAVSKWESESGLPEISQFPTLAKLFDVSIDYLMMGKIDETISLDDMDSNKRMFYLIKKDDVENYIKYDYPSKTYFDDFNSDNSAIASIIENKSTKIFNACVRSGIKLKPSHYNCCTLVGSIYEHIDTLIKMACDSDCLEFFKTIDFLSFAVGDKTQQLKSNGSVQIIHTSYRHTYDPKTAYLVSPDIFEYIFNCPAVSNRIVEYISTYRAFQSNSINYGSSVADWGTINGTFYFLEQNIIEQLYKTKRFELLSDFIQQINLDTAKTIKIYNELTYESQVFYKLQNGYLLRNDAGSYGRTTIIGKLITIDKKIVELAISNLDDNWTNIFVNYNRGIVKDSTKGILNYESKVVFAPDTQELNALYDEAKRQKRISKIKDNATISDKQRREQLFAENALSISDVICADDYDLFAKFPEEQTNSVTLLDVVNADCSDIRFYIHALNVDDNIQNLNTALKAILEKHPDRYDILDTLLSAGATIDDNVAFTNILKQNVALYFSSKETANSNVEIDNNVSKDILLKSLEEGKLEYVIVNLTMVLERKLKEKFAEQNMDLIDMIDKAHNLNTISDFECKMLHNLRKARNGIMHQSGKFYYTEPIVKTWIKIVYSL